LFVTFTANGANLSQSPAKGGQKVVHPAAAARTIVAVTFPPSFYYISVCVGFHAADSKLL